MQMLSTIQIVYILYVPAWMLIGYLLVYKKNHSHQEGFAYLLGWYTATISVITIYPLLANL